MSTSVLSCPPSTHNVQVLGEFLYSNFSTQRSPLLAELAWIIATRLTVRIVAIRNVSELNQIRLQFLTKQAQYEIPCWSFFVCVTFLTSLWSFHEHEKNRSKSSSCGSPWSLVESPTHAYGVHSKMDCTKNISMTTIPGPALEQKPTHLCDVCAMVLKNPSSHPTLGPATPRNAGLSSSPLHRCLIPSPFGQSSLPLLASRPSKKSPHDFPLIPGIIHTK